MVLRSLGSEDIQEQPIKLTRLLNLGKAQIACTDNVQFHLCSRIQCLCIVFVHSIDFRDELSRPRQRGPLTEELVPLVRYEWQILFPSRNPQRPTFILPLPSRQIAYAKSSYNGRETKSTSAHLSEVLKPLREK
jgi:hypothetical protein